MFSTSIPEWEIHFSNEPVAAFYMPTKRIEYYKIRSYGNKYFVIYKKHLKGIYELNPNRVWHVKKTPVYHYSALNGKPFDPILTDEINRFAKKHRLTKLQRKHVRQSNWLTSMFSKHKGDKTTQKELIKAQSNAEQDILTAEIAEGEKVLGELKNPTDTSQYPIKPTEKEEALFFIEYLRRKGTLPDEELDTFEQKIQTEKMSFAEFIDEMKTHNIITLDEPLDLDIQTYLDEFGTANPQDLSTFVDSLTDTDKKSKGMSAVPMKNFIPASVIMAMFIGGAIAVVAIGQNWDAIAQNFGGSGGAGFKLPFLP